MDGIVALALLTGITSACGAASTSGVPANSDVQSATTAKGNKVTDDAAGAPLNQRFRSLDDYLAFLELESHHDGKWYKEIRPGVYELQTGNLHLDNDRQKRIFTRDELAKKFGFSS